MMLKFPETVAGNRGGGDGESGSGDDVRDTHNESEHKKDQNVVVDRWGHKQTIVGQHGISTPAERSIEDSLKNPLKGTFVVKHIVGTPAEKPKIP